MTRSLGIAKRDVPAASRASYVADVAARGAAAAQRGVHHWVFQHATDPARFIEFTEGPDDSAVVAFAGDEVELWRAIEHSEE